MSGGITLDTPFPFGKYAGQPMAVVLADRNYTQWLMAQADFPLRSPVIFNFIATGGGAVEKDQTPAHNAMQVRFLHADVRISLVKAVFPAHTAKSTGDPVFEHFGWDVVFSADGEVFGVELKPGVSEDYPAVLRQVKDRVLRNKATGKGRPHRCIVLTDSFTARSATLEQVKGMFETSGIGFFTWGEMYVPGMGSDDFEVVADDFLN